MSQRGSKLALNFSGKNWVLKPPKKNKQVVKPKKIKVKKNSKKIMKENRWISICQKFNVDPLNFPEERKIFYKIANNTKMLQAMQKVKSYRLYCKIYNRKFSIEDYFMNEMYAIDYKKEYPDAYYFNVIKTNK